MCEWLKSLTVDDLTSIIQAVAVVAVAYPAFKGLTSWRHEILGKKKIELAEEALVLAYELEGLIEWARHSAAWGGEGQERPNRDDEEEGIQRLNDSYYSRVSRLNEGAEEFARLRKTKMLFRAHFGNEAQDALKEFIVVRNQISSAVGMLINHAGECDYPVNLRQQHQDVIWDHSTEDEPDAIRQRIVDAVAEIERVCKPI
ncbi:MAG: hypothetical protein OQK24_01520, partial [Magnetovibrio sp.]|nr:hypothetical protein [Magnetovibrio sp.]